ncbi:MAG: tol-pal system protein YbgF [Syntrophobacterales bacterium]|jgi:tol-pal system protein YbgF|nr:tol-pal system protein YbgF [Syntrophobacterales bacterium]
MRLFAITCLSLILAGCASAHETSQLRRNIASTDQELNQVKAESAQKSAELSKEAESIRKQLFNLNAANDEREDKMRMILGKLDELQHQLDTYWVETKREIVALKKGGPAGASAAPTVAMPKGTPETVEEMNEAPYMEAFEMFQKGSYDDSAQKFLSFVETYPKSPLVANAYFWLGESYMVLMDYDKAILYFQELFDKYPKNAMTPKALLSQADAFAATKDKKSSMTVLKKVIELFSKTEEAAIAERKLRSLNL